MLQKNTPEERPGVLRTPGYQEQHLIPPECLDFYSKTR